MPDLLPPTLPEMIKEAEREAATRRRVYPDWIQKGRLKPDLADRRIQLMEQMAATLHRFETLRGALEAAMPGLNDLVGQSCPDPEVAQRDREVRDRARAALGMTQG